MTARHRMAWSGAAGAFLVLLAACDPRTSQARDDTDGRPIVYEDAAAGDPGDEWLDRVEVVGSRVDVTTVGWRADLVSNGEVRPLVPMSGVHSLRLAVELDDALPQVSETLRTQIESLPPGGTIDLAVVPVFADSMIRPAPGSPSAYHLVIHAPGGSPELGAVDIRFASRATSAGCASLALSVWDAGMTRAVDSLLVAIPVGEGPEATDTCQERFETGGGIVSGDDAAFIATPEDASPAGNDAVVGLHAFEFAPPSGDRMNYVVFSHRATPASNATILGWEAAHLLSEAITSKQFEEYLRTAHRSLASSNPDTRQQAYQHASRLMHSLLFTAATPPPTGEGPGEALRLLQQYIETAEAPRVSARFSIRGTAANDLMYIPLQLLAWPVPGFLESDDFAVVQPLEMPRTARQSACIARWHLLVPRKLDGISGASRTRLENIEGFASRPWIAEHASDTQAFDDFLSSEGTADPEAQPEGLILLSHYRDAGLDPEWNAGNDTAPPVIAESFIWRQFPPGSAAFLAACETAAPHAADGLIDVLNGNGVDSVIASPFAINADYAINLTEQLLFELGKAYDAGEQATVEQLLDRAVMRAAAFYPVNQSMMGKQSLELVLAGNPQIRICAPQGSTP